MPFTFLSTPTLSSPALALRSSSFPLQESSTARERDLAMVERGGENGSAVEDGAVPGDLEDPRLQGISAAIRVVPHFPKPGIMFNDITTLLLRPKVFKDTVDLLIERYRGMGITVVAGIEARGFIFGPPLALALGAKFVPLRKPKKLPGQVISENYVLEYGTDCLEMHVGAVQAGERAIIIDDLVATGGTLCAAIRLLERAGGDVVECACIIGLPKFKHGRCKLNGKPVYTLVECRL